MSYNATEHHTRVLYDALVKQGETTETDEDKTTVGENPDQLLGAPADQPKGDIDAPWGQEDTPEGVRSKKNDPEHFSDAAMQGFIDSRQEMLNDLFDSKKPAAKAEQALVSQQLGHGASGDFESRAPLLEEKTSADRTLNECVRGLLG